MPNAIAMSAGDDDDDEREDAQLLGGATHGTRAAGRREVGEQVERAGDEHRAAQAREPARPRLPDRRPPRRARTRDARVASSPSSPAAARGLDELVTTSVPQRLAEQLEHRRRRPCRRGSRRRSRRAAEAAERCSARPPACGPRPGSRPRRPRAARAATRRTRLGIDFAPEERLDRGSREVEVAPGRDDHLTGAAPTCKRLPFRLSEDDGRTGVDDGELLAGDRLAGRAEPLRVLQPDVRQHGDGRREHVRRVAAARRARPRPRRPRPPARRTRRTPRLSGPRTGSRRAPRRRAERDRAPARDPLRDRRSGRARAIQ